MGSDCVRRAHIPGRTDIAEGDPVIWTRNDYARGLMNGSTGRIVDAHRDHATAVIDGQEHRLSASDSNLIELAYAISVHKAQGSQWPLVIVGSTKNCGVKRSLQPGPGAGFTGLALVFSPHPMATRRSPLPIDPTEFCASSPATRRPAHGRTPPPVGAKRAGGEGAIDPPGRYDYGWGEGFGGGGWIADCAGQRQRHQGASE